MVLSHSAECVLIFLNLWQTPELRKSQYFHKVNILPIYKLPIKGGHFMIKLVLIWLLFYCLENMGALFKNVTKISVACMICHNFFFFWFQIPWFYLMILFMVESNLINSDILVVDREMGGPPIVFFCWLVH